MVYIFGLEKISETFRKELKVINSSDFNFFKKDFVVENDKIFFSDSSINLEKLIENSHSFTLDELKKLNSLIDFLTLRSLTLQKNLKSKISFFEQQNEYLKSTLNSPIDLHTSIDPILDNILNSSESSKYLNFSFEPINNCSDKGSLVFLSGDNLFELSSDKFTIEQNNKGFKIVFSSLTYVNDILFSPLKFTSDVFTVFIEGEDGFKTLYNDVNISELKNISIFNKCSSISISGPGCFNLNSLPLLITSKDLTDNSSFVGKFLYELKNSSVSETSFSCLLPEGCYCFAYYKNHPWFKSGDLVDFDLSYVNESFISSEFYPVYSGEKYSVDFSEFSLFFYCKSSSSFIKKPIILLENQTNQENLR